MSNLIKFNSFVVKEEGNVIIDSNQKVLEKIKQIKNDLPTITLGGNGEISEDGFISGITAQVVEELVDDEEGESFIADNEDYENTSEIINNANEQAQNIVNDAMSRVAEITEAAKEEGYTVGIREAAEEIEKKIKELENEYSERKRELEEEYDKKFSKMEPVLVDTLLKVFSKVTHTMAEDKKDMIICLINSVLRNTDISREFYIRVSPEDYKFVMNNQQKIESLVAKDAHVEIAEDSTLARNECVIETDAGVFDCSLDIQLENLIKDIRLLSCMSD